MPRITISFSAIDFASLKILAQEKSLSLAQYLRELIDRARQLEVEPVQNVGRTLAEHPISETTIAADELWKQSLLCTLESRFLLRYLVDNLQHQPPEKREAVLLAVKEKAKTLVGEFFTDPLE